jgi:5'-3' exoribonuclease 1
LWSVCLTKNCTCTDCLYLDLNGIVHNAIHGNDPKRHERISKLDDLEELWAAIMRSIDELVHVVRPKKTLLLAVDGVAPRAKMNQQRARRFKSAKEREMLTN